MKQFFKFMFASMLGFFLTFVVVFFIFFVMIISVASFSKKEVVDVKTNSVLFIDLKQTIHDRGTNNPFEDLDITSFKPANILGLDDILKSIHKAKTDNNIKGICLDLGDINAGIATVEEIRNALIDFKESKKFIISYSEVYSQKAYYLASVADSIYMNPEGMLDFKGLNAQIFFIKGTLKKLEVEPQVIRHGKFKSAVEPFILDKMSAENKEQTQTYINSMWEVMVKNIAESRKISIAELNNIADSLKTQFPEDAVKCKLIDKIVYKDEFLAELKKKLGLDESKKINFVSLNKYIDVKESIKQKYTKNKIAVIFASGSIESGDGDENTIGSEKLSETIRDARNDSTIKAIVLRINSPGGSALASEVIWREVYLASKVKPVIASMGDLAASGGYYIACAANKIVANPNTITGSIGVFGVLPNMKGLFNNKLGITFDNVKTNKYADLGDVSRPLNEYEKLVILNSIERIYKTFINHVAEGRKMTTEQVDSIGQGRVWCGSDAKRIGLVDELGGLEKAIKLAAELAKLDNYKLVSLPKQKDPFTQIIEQFSGNTKVDLLSSELGDTYKYFEYIRSVSKMTGIQARLPYEIEIY
jgi:protease-4